MAGSNNAASADHEEIDRFERSFVAVAQGLDALAMRTEGYRILLSPIARAVPRRDFASWAEAAQAVEDLERVLPPCDRHTTVFAKGILHALHTFARVRAGVEISYLDQVRAYLELSNVWVDERALDALRGAILDLLDRLGLPTDLDRGLRAWSAQRRVRTEEIAAVAEPLIEDARQAAMRRGLPAPAQVTVDFVVRSSPYYAYAHYYGGYRGAVEFSSDIDWTVEAIKHSVCHEAFPGHQASSAAREAAIATGEWAPLTLPIMANTPTSPIAEGLAENGAAILDWISTPDDELFAAHNALTFGVLTNAAILRHEENMPREQVIDLMVGGAGVDPAWAAYQYKFLTDPLWHTSFPHYWHGAKLIQMARERFRGREEAMFRALYRRPQTVATLRELLGAAEPDQRSDSA